MNNSKLLQAITSYKLRQSETPESVNQELTERTARIEYYQSYTPDKIKTMVIDDLYEYIGKLWSMQVWGNKKYIVDKIAADNGFENLKSSLISLLYGKDAIQSRWDSFKKTIKGFGAATMSELLGYVNPDEYMLLNKNTIACFKYLEVPNIPVYEYQNTGKRYVEICNAAKEIAKVMKDNGIQDNNLLAVDYFFWNDVLPLTIKSDDGLDITPNQINAPPKEEAELLHNEVRDKIVEIGRLLGFESNSEIKVSSGAKVDAIWEAKIGNMGKAIYVFEVQSKGSVDSLILNLIRARNNPAVQAVVAVSDNDQLRKILNEIKGTSLENSLRTWDYKEVLEVYDSLVKAHESINKLELVPDSFI